MVFGKLKLSRAEIMIGVIGFTLITTFAILVNLGFPKLEGFLTPLITGFAGAFALAGAGGFAVLSRFIGGRPNIAAMVAAIASLLVIVAAGLDFLSVLGTIPQVDFLGGFTAVVLGAVIIFVWAAAYTPTGFKE